MQRDRHGDADGDEQHAEQRSSSDVTVSVVDRDQDLPGTCRARRAPGARRPGSASSTPSRACRAPVAAAWSLDHPRPPCRRSPGKRMRPAWNAVDALLVGGVVDRRVGAARPPRPAGPGARRGRPRRPAAGTPSVCGRGPVAGRTRRPAPGRASRGPARSAAACPAASLGEGRAVVNSTIEWIIDCGCTTTSIRSNGMSNSRCASITSSPLLTSVAELVVMTGPMSQWGGPAPAAGVTSAQRPPGVRPRNGPPLAVSDEPAHLRGAAAAQALGDGASARSRPARSGRAPAAALTSGPPTMSDSLLARASVRARGQGGQGRAQPDRAGDRR